MRTNLCVIVDREDDTVATDRAREPGLEVARDAITNL